MNYAITLKVIDYLTNPRVDSTMFYAQVAWLVDGYIQRVGLSYTNGNAVMGVLDCVVRELKRRVLPGTSIDVIEGEIAAIRDGFYNNLLAPYEDKKIAENGDVYPAEILN